MKKLISKLIIFAISFIIYGAVYSIAIEVAKETLPEKERMTAEEALPIILFCALFTTLSYNDHE